MISVNTNENQVYNLILDSLNGKKSLSVVRMGDGEISTLDYNLNKELTNRFYLRHTGKLPTNEHMVSISENLKSAIINADIIGISPEGIENRTTNPVWPLTNKIIYEVIKDSYQTKKYCDMNLHLKLNNKGLLDKILKSVDELYILTPRNVSDKIYKKYPNIKNIHHFKIPGQFIFEETPVIEDFYPSTYNKILEDLNNQRFDGKLLLFGGGFIGKNLGVKFAKMGGVSLDIGSIFDLFAGKITRGKGKGPNSYIKSILE